MPNLQELTRELLEVENLILQANGEMTQELEALLIKAQKDLVNKVDAYDHIMESLVARAEFLDMRAGELWASAKSIANFVQKLRDNIKIAMMQMQTDELPGETRRFKLTKGAKKLILQEDQIPADFKISTICTIPDKEKIKTALTLGQNVPGARLEDIISLRTLIKTKG